ncbi:MAG: hypothetical protein WAO35_01970 [Terriglobia bacterium]
MGRRGAPPLPLLAAQSEKAAVVYKHDRNQDERDGRKQEFPGLASGVAGQRGQGSTRLRW